MLSIGQRLASINLLLLCIAIAGCGRHTDEKTEVLSESAIIDHSGIVFYRAKSSGVFRHSSAHSPPVYDANSRLFSIVKYRFSDSSAHVVSEIDATNKMPRNYGPTESLLISNGQGWLHGKYEGQTKGCVLTQVVNGAKASLCSNVDDSVDVAVEVVKEPKLLIKASSKRFNEESAKLGFEKPLVGFAYIPEIEGIVFYGLDPLERIEIDAGKTQHFLIQLSKKGSAIPEIFQLAIPSLMEIRSVGFADKKLQFLIGPSSIGNGHEFLVIAVNDTGTQQEQVRFEWKGYLDTREDIAFIPMRNEVYFANLENNKINLYQVNYITKSKLAIPVD